MLLKEILAGKSAKIWSVSTEQTIPEVLHILVNNKIGAVLVLENEKKVVGIISERDIMKECYFNARDWHRAIVKDVMTKRVIVCTPDDTADYAMGVMTENRIRHIPVMEKGNLCGVISIGDVVKACLKDSQYEIQYLKDFIAGN